MMFATRQIRSLVYHSVSNYSKYGLMKASPIPTVRYFNPAVGIRSFSSFNNKLAFQHTRNTLNSNKDNKENKESQKKKEEEW